MLNKSSEAYHAEMLWKHLDDLAEKSPEDYKKFISENLKEGMKSYSDASQNNKATLNSKDKNSNSSSNKPAFPHYENNFNKDEAFLNKIFNLKKDKIVCKPFSCMRFKIKKFISNSNSKISKNSNNTSIIKELYSEDSIKHQDLSEIPKITFSFSFLDEANSSKVYQEPKIYLNIVESFDFYPPINAENKPETKTEKWNYIPSLFRPAGEKNSLRGIKCLFYDCIVNSSVCREISSNEKLKSSVYSYLCRKFNIFISDYCELYLKNVKLVSNHKYKSTKILPEEWLLDGEDKKYSNNNFPDNDSNKIISIDLNSSNNAISESNNPTSNTPLISTIKNFYDENKINIPSNSENFPSQGTFYNMPKNLKNNTNDKTPKQPLIQEITEKSKNKIESLLVSDTTVKKEIYLYDKKLINNNTMELHFKFQGFTSKLNSEVIDLQVSTTEMKILIDSLDLNSYTPIYLNFNGKFDLVPEDCYAIYVKKSKLLVVSIVKA